VVPLDGGAADVVAAQARLLGAPDAERDAATEALNGLLAHPLLARARAAEARGELRRETPVFLKLADGTLAEGAIDLAFREDGRWTVLEVKTDAELADTLLRSEAQVAVYVAAIEAATGDEAEGVIVVV
jgi:ATP-dependent helicase/nuclease subunit A